MGKAEEFFKKESLYERLGGVFPIAAVVDHFSDALIENKVVGINSANPALREWHRNSLDRLPGLKWLRTLWVCDVAGGPYEYRPSAGGSGVDLEAAHAKFKITSEEFDAVADELVNSLDHFDVPAGVAKEVLDAFAKRKGEVVSG